MFINEIEYYQHYLEYSGLIDGMRSKLLEAIKKNPKCDYSDAWNKIELLEALQTLFTKMYQSQIVIDNQNYRISKSFHNADEKIKALEKEIEILNKEKTF